MANDPQTETWLDTYGRNGIRPLGGLMAPLAVPHGQNAPNAIIPPPTIGPREPD